MSNFPAIATFLVIGLAATGAAVGAGQATGDPSDVCSIEAHARGGMVEIAGIIDSDTTLAGSYRFEVAGSGPSGNSNINQGGSFEAGPSGPVTLGKVTLNSSGATYDVRLAVSTPGTDFVCQDRIAAR